MSLLRRHPFNRLHALALIAFVAGCTPEIGDKCVLSTDCSTRGDRLCDTSQPGGYCTQFNCMDYSCPDQAVCVLFNAAVPGCGYDDHAGASGSRIARSFCVAKCANDGDCRAGYICADPHLAPWSGLVLDDDQSRLGCLVPPQGYGVDAGADSGILFTPGPPAPVCGTVGPDVAPIDAGAAHLTDSGVLTPPPLVGDSGAVDAADAGVSDAGDSGDAG